VFRVPSEWFASVVKSPEVRGRVFYTLKHDSFVGKTLQEGKYWEEWMLEYIRKYYAPGTDMIDIGGNIGSTALLMEEVLSPGCQVHVFEPIFHELIQKTLDENSISKERVVLYEAGVGKSNTTLSCNVDRWDLERNFGNTLLQDQKPTEDASQYIVADIPIVKLDGFLKTKRRVSLVKIDVEGMETDVLEGMIEQIRRDRPVILIEIWGHKLEAYLSSHIGKEIAKTHDIFPIPEGSEDFILIPKPIENS
jgi:FkbM family methyltransferase